jgi:nicotinamidase-related amidase
MTTALVVIDVQQGFDEPAWGARNNPEAEDRIGALVTAWRDAGQPIVLVRHDSTNPQSPLRSGQPGNDFKPVLAGVDGAILVTKQVNSAFIGEPDLHAWLQQRGISRLVLCGIQTNMCVETTARMGGNLGYDVTVALDATHTFDLSGPDGVNVTADELVRTTAVNLHGGAFARIAGANDVIAELSSP